MRARHEVELDVRACVSEPSGFVNEDAVGFTSRCAWVIDGATGVAAGLLDSVSDAHWFAVTADRALRDILACEPQRSTADLLREVSRTCGALLAREALRQPSARHEHPSAAIALVRAWPHRLELTTLGDCRIAYRDGAGAAQVFGPSEIEVFERRTLAAAAALRRERPDVTAAELRALLLPQLQENRRAMNTPGGYWVLSTDPAAIDHLAQITLPFDADGVAIASDGFLRLVELFGAVTPDRLLEVDDTAGAQALLHQLRGLEAADPEGRAFPRVKLADDASFLRVRRRSTKTSGSGHDPRRSGGGWS